MSYPLREIAPPSAEPLSLARVRIHLRQGSDDPSALLNFDSATDDDSWILSVIKVAREYVEQFLGYPITDATYSVTQAGWGASTVPLWGVAQSGWDAVTWPSWVAARGGNWNAMTLPGWAATIVAVKYLDAANVEQTLATSQYWFEPYSTTLTFDGAALPVLSTRGAAVRISFKADPQSVPESILHAMLLLIAHWYKNREAVGLGARLSAELSLGVESLLRPWRMALGFA